jgi:hypothetical protein
MLLSIETGFLLDFILKYIPLFAWLQIYRDPDMNTLHEKQSFRYARVFMKKDFQQYSSICLGATNDMVVRQS